MSVYKYVTERIIAELEKGVIPWKKPWKGQKAINYVSRKEYQGINTLLLPFPGEYLTFNQVRKLKGKVKKGEKSSMIVFYKFIEKKNKDGEVTETFPLLRYYNVFHLSQTEDIDTKSEAFKAKNDNEVIEDAEKVVKDYVEREKIKLQNILGSDRAYYSQSEDKIVLPDLKQFVNSHEYYSTAFHEMTHSAGHKSRLDRFKDTESYKFGSESYSKEELIAEVGSAMLCNHVGVEIPETFENSVAYIQSWIKVLKDKDNARLVTTAASAAQRAVNFILEK